MGTVALAAKITHVPSMYLSKLPMKWKKFLYRQLCAREGIYVCPAPSCGVCTDFAKCFGPEN